MTESPSPSSPVLKAAFIKETARELGADLVGLAAAAPVEHQERLLAWLADGCAGDMRYMGKNIERRLDPGQLLPGARSIIVIAVNYGSDEPSRRNRPFRVARYARGEDYHDYLRSMLERFRGRLRTVDSSLRGRICVDTAPFMDKYWAHRAGLGWPGKHTNLVSRTFGNWLLIGSLIIDRTVDKYDRPHPDHCGTCTACIEACPTGAIERPYRLNAVKCISYWTIETKADQIPDHIAREMNRFVFGCDICLAVCPFNRFARPSRHEVFRRLKIIDRLEDGRVDDLSDEASAAELAASPLNRPGLAGLKRNIAAARTAT